MRIMSLHGISRDAWKRYTAEGSWFYEILQPGFKYNLTDIAAALGIEQLKRHRLFREARCRDCRALRSRRSPASRGSRRRSDGPTSSTRGILYVIQLRTRRSYASTGHSSSRR